MDNKFCLHNYASGGVLSLVSVSYTVLDRHCSDSTTAILSYFEFLFLFYFEGFVVSRYVFAAPYYVFVAFMFLAPMEKVAEKSNRTVY